MKQALYPLHHPASHEDFAAAHLQQLRRGLWRRCQGTDHEAFR